MKNIIILLKLILDTYKFGVIYESLYPKLLVKSLFCST